VLFKIWNVSYANEPLTLLYMLSALTGRAAK